MARAGKSSAGDNLVVYEVNGSGIAGDIDLDGTGAVSDLVLEVGYSEGDYFEFYTNSDEAGAFQCFFRDNLGRTLPCGTGGDITVSDSLAGGS